MRNRERDTVDVTYVFKHSRIELLVRKARQREIRVTCLQLENTRRRHVIRASAVVFYAVVDVDAGLGAKHLLDPYAHLAFRSSRVRWRNFNGSQERAGEHHVGELIDMSAET